MIYVLEIPRVPGCPVLRHVFDPLGRDFPADSRERISALMSSFRHGIIYAGISKAAAYDVMLTDPRILNHPVHLFSLRDKTINLAGIRPLTGIVLI